MELNRKNLDVQKQFPEKVIQFGEGNFLRAFADWIINEMNLKANFNGSVVVVQPIEKGLISTLNEQDGLYHLCLKGIKKGQPVKEVQLIESVNRGINPYLNFDEYLKIAENPASRFIISNTTEAGISYDDSDLPEMKPPRSFPAKLTLLLYHRFKCFKGSPDKGFVILPCELIENNGKKLKECIIKYCEKWKLEKSFIQWINESNVFCNTLVDRIVPGYSAETADETYQAKHVEDKLAVEAEQFHLWVIEGPQWIKNEFPAEKAGLNVLFVTDVTPYRTRKVCILNGLHTIMTPVAILGGIEYVRDAVQHQVIGKFIQQTLYNEIIPTLELPKDELEQFAEEVMDRFRNPFIQHALMSISLNSVSKFKARVLGSLLAYNKKNGRLPKNIVISLAALIAFYSGKANDKIIEVKDEQYVLELFKGLWNNYELKIYSPLKIVETFLKDERIWGDDLTKIPNLAEETSKNLIEILNGDILKLL